MTHKHTLMHAHLFLLWSSPPATLQWKSHDGPLPAQKKKNPSENLDHKNINKHFFSIYVKKKKTQQIHRGSFKGILILAVL